MRILVAEDERVLANTIATALRATLPAEVDVAHDGAIAHQLAQKHEYALALVDFCLPPPTGLELVWLWREAGNRHPILMMSGGDGTTRLREALAAGATGCLEKPFSLTDLIQEARTSLKAELLTGQAHE